MKITAAAVNELRKITGAGMMDCKKALQEANGDIVGATDILRKKGLASLAKRAGREAKEGVVDSYIHAGGKIGVLVEVNSETDFVARSDDFKQFVHDIALQIAAGNPLYVTREDVPDDVIAKEAEIYRAQGVEEGKPDNVLDKIATGRLEKYYTQVVLMEQVFVKNPDLTMNDYLGEIAAKLGENIGVRRFVRYELGETI
ncbi:MAG: translation elongation factor Ts [Candidatus Aquicultor secundus]|uniref:Elongation factor Ts n=1 Tax=Candidatus Aquicultor secundus TaxID=1973895 RepID=A0A2M7T5W4_9ACTN|nr:translation elongation factor Ts [Candidatus Aquicultor secundus]NCO66616.1 translation elongation factor Ts [Solirubrobacter sp.]OIO88445.1 MAG: translation elongation factor Ts [Candidatus Aquicultor secundus]PIU26269.1 MAG: translation elongation factor Ts [Candidatus Aquicultor secundus]PIW22280.1 MAG: translation elongation factor Ts [Candidatus Aquicultor secundus]PIX51423.1 MAG: translation elongation factor Ts [Candidatus Aquicultor secundus]